MTRYQSQSAQPCFASPVKPTKAGSVWDVHEVDTPNRFQRYLVIRLDGFSRCSPRSILSSYRIQEHLCSTISISLITKSGFGHTPCRSEVNRVVKALLEWQEPCKLMSWQSTLFDETHKASGTPISPNCYYLPIRKQCIHFHLLYRRVKSVSIVPEALWVSIG